MTDAISADDVAIRVEAVQLGPAGDVRGAVGVVEDAAGRAAAWQGRRVLVGMFDACGECDVCRRGGAPVCPRGRRRELGAGDRHTRAAARWLVALDDGLVVDGPAAAAVPGDVAFAYTLYARTGVAPRDPVVITGGDAVARFLVEILLAKGVAPVMVVDPAAEGAEAWSAWLGARGAGLARISAAASDADARAAATEAIAAIAQDPTAAKTGGRPWRVIATDDLPRAAALAGPRATLTARAGAVADGGAALVAALAREVAILGVAGPHPDLVLEAAALVAKGELDLAAGVLVRRADDAPSPDVTRAHIVVPPD